ncbi:MAG: hypothetical protein AAGP08_07155 [Pseudomonadota bacterium]
MKNWPTLAYAAGWSAVAGLLVGAIVQFSTEGRGPGAPERDVWFVLKAMGLGAAVTFAVILKATWGR